jgi:hypothetical protein
MAKPPRGQTKCWCLHCDGKPEDVWIIPQKWPKKPKIILVCSACRDLLVVGKYFQKPGAK